MSTSSTGDGFRRYADHLSDTERHSAYQILTNQRDALLRSVKAALRQAYGLERPTAELIDTALLGDGEAADVIVLSDGFAVQRPVGANLREGFEHLLGQALAHEFPATPCSGGNPQRGTDKGIRDRERRGARARRPSGSPGRPDARAIE